MVKKIFCLILSIVTFSTMLCYAKNVYELKQSDRDKIIESIFDNEPLGYNYSKIKEDDFEIKCYYISSDENIFVFNYTVYGYFYCQMIEEEYIGHTKIIYSQLGTDYLLLKADENKIYTLQEAYDLKLIDDQFLVDYLDADPLFYLCDDEKMDINSDGKTDVLDLVILRNQIVSRTSCSIDFNGDGILDIQDIMLLRNFIITQ